MSKKGHRKPKIKLEYSLKQLLIKKEEEETDATAPIIFDKNNNRSAVNWPKPKSKIPPVFLHKPADLERYIYKLLKLGINLYQPKLNAFYTKICCVTFNDRKALTQFLDKNQLPYHTFGQPSKTKLKVVINGLTKDIDLDVVKNELKSASIPIIRLHKMNTKTYSKAFYVLAVLPNDAEGKKILSVKKILGHEVKIERPHEKPKQCHRCQKWGHSQRYCHGKTRCVKCAGDHFTKKCLRNRDETPPKCANCGGEHTASYKKCKFYPDPAKFQVTKAQCEICPLKAKKNKLPPEVVTLENYNNLYWN